MFLKKIGEVVALSTSKLGFWTKQHSPELLIIGGIISTAASIALAIKATTKLDSVIKPANEKINKIHEKMENETMIATGEYSISHGKKDLTVVYAKTGFELFKLYAPSAIAFSLSVAAMVGSHNVMKGRNLALAAAYTTLENGYKGYRERIRAKIGEKAEEAIYRGETDEEIVVSEVGKDGKEKEVTKKIKSPKVNVDSDPYLYVFDASNPNWSPSGRKNLDFLIGKQMYFNQRLRARGHLFLHEVYDGLGIEPYLLGENKVLASRFLGWVYNPEIETIDNYISLGICDDRGNLLQNTAEALRRGERDIFIEFNCDGDILNNQDPMKNFSKYANAF